MSKETLVLHSMHAEPVDGGQLFGSGRMVVAPWAESYEGAVSIKAEGVDLPAEELALRYLPGVYAPGRKGDSGLALWDVGEEFPVQRQSGCRSYF